MTTKSESKQKTEAGSLKTARLGYIVMGIAGLIGASLSGSDAILLDGMYSFVMAITSFVAIYISSLLQKGVNDEYPFGYASYEAMYLTFKGLLVLIIMVMAFFGSVSTIIGYLGGEQIAPLKTNVILVYVIFTVSIALSLSYLHNKNYKKTKSVLLKTESVTTLIDGLMSAGAGVALIAVSFLEGTGLEPIVPIADSLVVLLLVIFMAKEPIKLFKTGFFQLVGKSIVKKDIKKAEKIVKRSLSANFNLLKVKAVQMGRSCQYVIYLKPTVAMNIEELDRQREILIEHAQEIDENSFVEVVYAGEVS